MLMALAAIVPVGLIIFNWIGTLTGGVKRHGMPFRFALGAIVLIVIGLAGKLVTAVVPVGALLAGTTFTTGTSFALIAGAGVFGGFAALHYWFPKLSGRMMGDAFGITSYWLLLVGAVVYVLTTMMAGLEGMPVDVAKFYGDSGLDALNLIASIAAILFVLGFIVAPLNAATSYRHGLEAGPDPWGAARSSGSRPRLPRFTTSTSFPTSGAPSRSTTSARRSGAGRPAGTRRRRGRKHRNRSRSRLRSDPGARTQRRRKRAGTPPKQPLSQLSRAKTTDR